MQRARSAKQRSAFHGCRIITTWVSSDTTSSWLFPAGRATTSRRATFLRRPALWLQTISRVRATYASAPNFGFEYCLRPGKINSSDLIGVDLSCLQVLMSAAEPVQPRTVRRFIERFRPYGLKPEACVVAYGLAESTLAVAHYGRRFVTADPEKLRTGGASLAPLHDDDGNGVAYASCGRALPGIEVLIVDPQTHTVLPEHRVGEIWIAGASVCRGYRSWFLGRRRAFRVRSYQRDHHMSGREPLPGGYRGGCRVRIDKDSRWRRCRV